MMRTGLLVLAALAACAAASVGAVDVCEAYSRAECLEHADKCVPCKAWDKVEVCFEVRGGQQPQQQPAAASSTLGLRRRRMPRALLQPASASAPASAGLIALHRCCSAHSTPQTAIAQRLPEKLFSCDFPAPPAPPEQDPDTDCQAFKDEVGGSRCSTPGWYPLLASCTAPRATGIAAESKAPAAVTPSPLPLQAACSHGGCVWCLSAAVPSACYTAEEAKRLPAAVFQCKLSSAVE